MKDALGLAVRLIVVVPVMAVVMAYLLLTESGDPNDTFCGPIFTDED